MRAPLRLARFWFQFLVTAGFIVLLAWRVDIGEALATLPEANWLWVIPAVCVFTLAKAVFTLRWRVFLGSHRDLPYSGLFGIFLVHNMANAILLLRAGDILRIQTTSQRYGITRSEVTATVIVVETLLDGLAFVALVAVAFSLGAIPGVLKATFWALAGLALFGLLLGVFAARYVNADGLAAFGPLRWLSQDARSSVTSIVGQFMEGMRALREPGLALVAIPLSLIGWSLEAVSFGLFGQAFGLELAPVDYVLVMMTANFAVSIPLTPSGIGPYEVAIQELVVALGTERSLATGYAIGMHLCVIIWVTITGLVAMWMMKLTPDDIFYLSQDREGEPQAQPGAT
jgi:uncharacterized protein (TIRG00374 family)